MQCLTLALENPPAAGEYRVFNQFEEVYDMTELAQKVQRVSAGLGIELAIHNLDNPRKESEEHHYKPDHENLAKLGYKPTRNIDGEIFHIISDLAKHRDRIEAKREVLIPDIRWDGVRRRSEILFQKTRHSRR